MSSEFMDAGSLLISALLEWRYAAQAAPLDGDILCPSIPVRMPHNKSPLPPFAKALFGLDNT